MGTATDFRSLSLLEISTSITKIGWQSPFFASREHVFVFLRPYKAPRVEASLPGFRLAASPRAKIRRPLRGLIVLSKQYCC